MLNDNQKALGKSIAVLAGTTANITLKLAKNQEEAQAYKQLIKDEIDTAFDAPESDNPVKDEVEAILDTANQIDNNLPDGTNGKKKLKAVIAFVTGVTHFFGL